MLDGRARPAGLDAPEQWIELSGLPPQRLPEYDARHDLTRLARRGVFGTDWPGMPGIARTAAAVADLLPEDLRALVLGGNAMSLYAGLSELSPANDHGTHRPQREEP